MDAHRARATKKKHPPKFAALILCCSNRSKPDVLNYKVSFIGGSNT